MPTCSLSSRQGRVNHCHCACQTDFQRSTAHAAPATPGKRSVLCTTRLLHLSAALFAPISRPGTTPRTARPHARLLSAPFTAPLVRHRRAGARYPLPHPVWRAHLHDRRRQRRRLSRSTVGLIARLRWPDSTVAGPTDLIVNIYRLQRLPRAARYPACHRLRRLSRARPASTWSSRFPSPAG